ncbi:glutaredoxin family protein [Alicyclobacillus suci]|uniref:glutaredoxin family protein n=1 Tax=Alicyclobacillus suci TaxID=2816080 RepID=UPI001A90960A
MDTKSVTSRSTYAVSFRTLCCVSNTIVKIYASPMCVFCEKTKEFLNANGVKYEEVDTTTENGYKELNELEFNVVPVLVIDGGNEVKIREAIGI